jgi:6-methylsalicylate decarboxylase
MAKQRIDVHQHVLPPFWVEGLKARKSVHRPPAWTPEAAIAYMDSRQIAKGILSLTAPGLANWAADERRDMARQVNAYTASLATQWPGRFGNFATLPLPDLEGALLEIAHALDTLGADGVVLLSNYEGRYLGDTCFDPVWAELDRREATVLIHPTRLAMPELEGIPGPFVDFPFDTTRTAVDMVMKGVFQRHGKVRVILSHAGGFLPYAAQRFASCAATMPGQSDEQALMGEFRRFYFDTALSTSPYVLPSLTAFADPSHIVFGSDYPYGPGRADEKYTAMLDASTLLSPAEHVAIARENAEALFGNTQG